MRSRFMFALVSFGLVLLTAQPAAAGKRSFSLDPYGSRTDNGASRELGTFGTGGIVLPDSGNPDFGFGFMIPAPYKKNSPIRIILFWSTQDANCGIVLEPEYVERTRVGHVATTGISSGGLVPEDSSTVLAAPAVGSTGASKAYLLNPEQGFTQENNDAILLAFARNDGNSNDTCTSDLVITGIKIEYSTP